MTSLILSVVCLTALIAVSWGACPVCPPLQFVNQANVPSILTSSGRKVACSSISQMDEKCYVKLACWGTDPTSASTTVMFSQSMGRPEWGGTPFIGDQVSADYWICTEQGWMQGRGYDKPSYLGLPKPIFNNTLACMAHPPRGMTQHVCQPRVSPPLANPPTLAPPSYPNCPVCAPLRIINKAEYPIDFAYSQYKPACGSVTAMNSSCMADVICSNSNPPSDDDALIYSQRTDTPLWNPAAFRGSSVATYVCTTDGWKYISDYRKGNPITQRNTFACVAIPRYPATANQC